MDPKPRPNHQLYLEALRRLTPEQRLLKALELTELSRELFRAGLRQRFPEAGEAELQRIYLERFSRRCASARPSACAIRAFAMLVARSVNSRS
jgi:hypothetical protein